MHFNLLEQIIANYENVSCCPFEIRSLTFIDALYVTYIQSSYLILKLYEHVNQKFVHERKRRLLKSFRYGFETSLTCDNH